MNRLILFFRNLENANLSERRFHAVNAVGNLFDDHMPHGQIVRRILRFWGVAVEFLPISINSKINDYSIPLIVSFLPRFQEIFI